ncbi:hypothetical protein F2Q69_00040985 [Brassica cretica]|uniref:Uncharacterized protein n=1 Tax=Brassica cretica TaxID=69181 RepID=A0A8S9NUP4_BRACR|nr:hypothetical protein F2Q69_00040985 [Brassica cretica]
MRDERREEESGSVCLVSLKTSLQNAPSSSPRRAIVSLSMVRRRKVMLPLRGSARKRRYSLSVVLLSPYLTKTIRQFSLFVAHRGNEEGPLSLSRLLSSGKEISDYLCHRGYPRRRRTALSIIRT